MNLLLAVTVTSAMMRGPFPIMSTPYLEDGAVDYDGLAREVRYLEKCGTPGAIWCQSNDAVDLLTTEEKFKGFEACAAAAEDMNLVLTLGANGTNTAHLIEIATEIEAVAARHPKAKIAMISRPPDDVRSEADLEAAWGALGKVAKRPVIFQTFGTTETPTPSVELVVRLAKDYPHCFGYIKEEAAGWGACERMIEENRHRPDIKRVRAGWGGWQWLIQLRECGAEGLVTERVAYAPIIMAIWNEFNNDSRENDDRLTAAYALYRLMIDQRNFPGGGLRNYSLYYLVKEGIFKTTVTRRYVNVRETEGGSFGYGNEWKLDKLELPEIQRRELDRLHDTMMRFVNHAEK